MRDSAAASLGLSSAEAARRLVIDGPNELPRPKPPSVFRKLGAQLFHFFALMLWMASGLAVLAGMPELGLAIVIVVLVNGVFAYIQEQRAERAAEQLEALLPRRARVWRDGRIIERDAAELVVGDRVQLATGDRISADLTLCESDGLSVDMSLLTGESVPVSAGTGALAFAGTFVVGGEGSGIVTATGDKTRLARVAALTRQNHRPAAPLTKELNRLVRTIAAVAVVLGLTFFAVGVAVGLPATDGFLFAVGVTVALVPEGLLPSVTLSLAVAARSMAGRKALVRRLDAVQTLGSTTFVCTDKTGTLTENRMSVVQAWTRDGVAHIRGEGYAPQGEVSGDSAGSDSLRALALGAARCSSARVELREGQWEVLGDPMEGALWVLAARLGVDVDRDARQRPVLQRHPFDPRRRRMSVLLSDQLLVKGAPEALLALSRAPSEALAVTERWSSRGLRVLAVAARAASSLPSHMTDDAESELDLLGLVALEDPPRKAVRDAIIACRGAGLRVAMITGDHPGTALAIAREVGLGDGPVLEGKGLPEDEALLGALLDREGVVVARVSPEDKLRIARALQRRGHVVAMTGDGVNDGPALQQADIGVAMGRSGTDVARAAADLVLLDDNFATIVVAIEQGRATYANVRRFLAYHLTDNVAELAPFVVWALSGGRFPLALGVLQVLCLDLLTDQLPALALGIEAPGPRVLQRPPTARHLVDRALLVRAFLVLGLAEAAVELVAFGMTLVERGWRPGTPVSADLELHAASGAAFCAVVLAQAANAFACRSETRPVWRLRRAPNRLLVLAVGSELLILASSLFVKPIAHLLGQDVPSVLGGVLACAAVPVVVGVDGAYKWWVGRRASPSAARGR